MQFPVRITRRLVALIPAFGIAWVSVASIAPAEDETSTQQGVYTAEQAEKGEKLFGEVCMVCHQPEEFSEGGYMEGWSGQKASDMLGLIRSTMPEDNPGRLKRREYVDIMAYLFSLNGLPTGDTAMESTTMKNIRIEGPYSTGNH